MTDMPANAPRSEDGQWWWDGAQWQAVTAQQAAAAPAAAQAQAPTATAAPSETVGQLSEDGQWRWDGTQWQPVQARTAAATAGSAAATPAGRHVTLGVPTAEAHTAPDGTPAVIVKYSITNSGTTQIEARTLQIGFYVSTANGAAENAAYVSGDVLVALAPGEAHQGQWPLQVDPGSWKVWVAVSDDATGEPLATSEDVAVEVAGQRALAHDFDDTQAYSLTVTITNVEHVAGVLYRVHYDMQSDRDVPPGLHVSGSIDTDASQSGQIYDLTTGIAAGRPHAHYLTLEADVPSHSIAKIYVDPGGPSEKSDSVTLDIAEDGTPTMSR
jgi:hypothetical protein